ncbi:unnamed protein product [Calypogeia fissa]
MPINIILIGATGTAGSRVLHQAIVDLEAGWIMVLNHRPLDIEHEKLKVIIHKDFNYYEDIAAKLGDHQATLWCLGISLSSLEVPFVEVLCGTIPGLRQ